jgi:hypothetical protein
MQEQPVRRFHQWRDEECAMRAFRELHIWFFSIATISLVCLVIVWYYCGLGYLPALAWLIGYLALRFFMPPVYIWINPLVVPDGSTYTRLMDSYTFINVCWYVYGFVMWIFAWMEIVKPFNSQHYFWILIFCSNTIDGIIGCFLLCNISDRKVIDGRANVQEYQPINTKADIKVDNPNITKHGFYDTCVVCYDNFKSGEDVFELKCKHIFHPKCINDWMEKKKACPTCNVEI